MFTGYSVCLFRGIGGVLMERWSLYVLVSSSYSIISMQNISAGFVVNIYCGLLYLHKTSDNKVQGFCVAMV